MPTDRESSPTPPRNRRDADETDQPGSTIEEAVKALRAGRVVGLPTETVYGLAVRADRADAVAALRATKGRSATHVFTLHLADPEDADPFVARWLAPALRLRSRYWPGPVTLVLPGSESVPIGALDADAPTGAARWVGLRVPATDITREILRRAEVPVVATSANLSGRPPATTRAEVPPEILGRLAAAVADRGSTVATPSTVVAVGPGRFEVLREGILRAEEIRRTAGRRILVVCTGNTCRSPMAETYLRARLVERLGGAEGMPVERQRTFLDSFGYAVASAGVSPEPGASASEGARVAIAEIGLSLEGHRARSLDAEMLAPFDVVWTMSERHAERVRELGIEADRVERLDPERDVADPFGAPPEQYRRALAQIREAIDRRLGSL